MMRFVPLITSVLFVGVTACGADPELSTGAGGVTPDFAEGLDALELILADLP